LPEKKTYGAGKRLPDGLASRSSAASPSARLPPLEPTVENITNMADGPLVTGSVFGVEVTFLVDTGANVTILKPSVVNKIPVLERPSLKGVDTSMLLADGSSLSFQGRGCFSIQIGDQQVEHDVWVAEIELDGTFGMDLIKEHNCWLTLGKGCSALILSGNVTVFKGINQLPKCSTVVAKVTTVIPPRSESVIPVKLINSCGGALVAITEGQERFTKRSQLLVAKSLVDLSSDVFPL